MIEMMFEVMRFIGLNHRPSSDGKLNTMNFVVFRLESEINSENDIK